MQTKLRQAIVLGLALIVAGIGVFLIKTVRLGYPVTPGATATIWDFEIYLEFEGRDEPARLEVYLPAGDVQRSFPQEQFYNGPFGLSLVTEAATQNRKAIWTYRYPSNRKVLRYMAQTLGENATTPLPASFTQAEPEIIPFEADLIKRQAFIVWAGDLRRRSADDHSFADLALKESFENRTAGEEYADVIAVLLDGRSSVLARLDLARHTLQSAGIPARIANGVYLTETRRRVEGKHWLEYHIAGEDFRFFPDGPPNKFFTIWYGTDDLVTVNGIDELDVQIGLQAHRDDVIDIVRMGQSRASAFGSFFSFDELPLTTQLVYKVLLTIPVGITILVFLRQFIGFKTLGTFMPVLIGIAFRETALINGLLLFTLLVALGLALRFYLERLQLLLVPRLAVVVIFIVMVMAGITVTLTGANQAIGLSISLFPIVILTMTIERMSIVWEESSAGEAIKQGMGSLAIASISYLVMSNSNVEYLMYQFPELLLALMGLCVLMGRYTGLRLSELWRFRQLAS
jgi:7 transmembrane helices usually fused to an inactive transglutaminase/Inactive transglutaminase fused to 7 transmembrane helices